MRPCPWCREGIVPERPVECGHDPDLGEYYFAVCPACGATGPRTISAKYARALFNDWANEVRCADCKHANNPKDSPPCSGCASEVKIAFDRTVPIGVKP